jgi:hypothetical protein
VLRILVEAGKGLSLHEIADRISKKTGERIWYQSVAGAFSHRRTWVESDTGRLNDQAKVSISDEGRAALEAYDANREATHPMGPVVPDRFFVFVEEVQVVRRHTMVVRNVASAEEAEAVARAQCDRGEYPAAMTVSTERSFVVRPVRAGHGA